MNSFLPPELQVLILQQDPKLLRSSPLLNKNLQKLTLKYLCELPISKTELIKYINSRQSFGTLNVNGDNIYGTVYIPFLDFYETINLNYFYSSNVNSFIYQIYNSNKYIERNFELFNTIQFLDLKTQYQIYLQRMSCSNLAKGKILTQLKQIYSNSNIFYIYTYLGINSFILDLPIKPPYGEFIISDIYFLQRVTELNAQMYSQIWDYFNSL